MNDALDPIRHLYSDGSLPEGTAPDPPSGAEYDLLRHTKTVLDRMPRSAPDSAALDAVREAAAAYTFAPLRHAYGEAEGVPAPDSPQHAEYDLLRTTKAALETVPRVHPDASVLSAVAAMAAEHTLRPLRQVYGEVDGAPEVGPPRAAEYALLHTAKAALDTLPRLRPDAAVLAVIAEAAKRPATGAGTRAADRPAGPRRTRRWGAWVGTAAAVLVAALTGLWALQNGPASSLTADASLAPAPTPPRALPEDAQANEETTTPDALAQAASPTLAPERQAVIASGRVAPSSAAPAAPGARRERAAGDADERIAADLTVPAQASVGAGAVLPVSSWEAGEDVRLLSLRLQQLAESNEGLSWDEPVVPLGTMETGANQTADPGIQSVRDGAAPARVEARMRTGTPVRSSGQQPN